LDGVEDDAEDVSVGSDAGCGDDGPDVGFAFGGPHGAVAVGHLALDDGRSKAAFAAVVVRLDEALPVSD